MIALEVYINGQKVCTAAHPDQATLHARVTRDKLMARRSLDADTDDRVLKESIHVNVGGIRHGASSDEHANWIHRPIAVGDEVTIKIVETDNPDEPASFSPV